MKKGRTIASLIIITLLLGGCANASGSLTNESAIQDFVVPGVSVSDTSGATLPSQQEKMGYNSLAVSSRDGMSVLRGELLPNVHVDAIVITDRDINSPGSAGMDICEMTLFPTEVSDYLLSESDKIISDKLWEGADTGELIDYRYIEFEDQLNRTCMINNVRTSISVFYGEYYEDANLVPKRFPASNDDYPWGTEDFSFSSRDDSIAAMKEVCDKLSIDVSPVMEINLLTPEALALGLKVKIASGDDQPDRIFEDDDGIYRIEGYVNWKGFPITRGDFGDLYLVNLTGEEAKYYLPLRSFIDCCYSREGIQYMDISCPYQNVTSGEPMDLVNLEAAMTELAESLTHENDGISNSSEPIDRTIGSITLCYVPFYVNPIDPKIYYRPVDEELPDDYPINEEKKNQVILVPCWEFYVEETLPGTTLTTKKTYLVDAISGDFLPQYEEVHE